MTAKKKAFINAYINDIKKNQTAAAIKAGYSEKTAEQAASRLMKDPEVAAAIKEWEEEQHRERTAETNEIIEFLTSVMRGEKVDNIPLFIGNGEQKLKTTSPAAHDRIRAAEMLGKYYAIFTDKAQIDSAGTVKIIDDIEGGETYAEAE